MSVIVKGKNANKPYTVRYWAAGKQREKSFATAGEARDFKIKADHDLRAQIFTDPKLGRELFGTYAAAWADRYPCAPATRKGLRQALNGHLRPLHGRTLADLSQDRDGVSELLQVTIPATAPTLVKIARQVITMVMDEAVRSGRISGHRLGAIDVPDPGRTRKPFVLATQAQLQVIADGMPHGLVIWLMHGLGLRVSEALAVNVGGFREAGTVYRVSEQATPDGKGTAPLKHRKAGEHRDVPVPAWLWAKVQAAEVQPDGYVFAGRNSRFPTYASVDDSFTRYAGRAKIGAGFTPHSIRHGYASTLLAARVPITDLAAWLGHRDIRETYGTYGHLVPSAWGAGRRALEAGWDESQAA